MSAAYNRDPFEYTAVLLAGEAGLRRGELAALKWPEVDLKNNRLTVSKTLYKGQLTAPKGNKSRTLEMSDRLREALTQLPSRFTKEWVLLHNGEGYGTSTLNNIMFHLTRAAGLKAKGARKVHILRHTFCSHLAMLGADAVQIQALAGHVDLKTTQEYMHLSPGHANKAVRLLNGRPVPVKIDGKVVALPELSPAPASAEEGSISEGKRG